MFVLGIDPGLSRCGYAVLERTSRGKAKAVAIGVLKTPKDMPTANRLALLHKEYLELLEDFKPAEVAIERIFFYKNLNTVLGVTQASGIVQAASVTFGATVAEYSPSEAKSVITGYGSADKEQVQFMVKNLLNLVDSPKPADAADAAAIALCHIAYNPKPSKHLEKIN